MQRWCLAAALAAAMTCVLAPSAMAKERAADRLDVYTVVTTADKLCTSEALKKACEENGVSG